MQVIRTQCDIFKMLTFLKKNTFDPEFYIPQKYLPKMREKQILPQTKTERTPCQQTHSSRNVKELCVTFLIIGEKEQLFHMEEFQLINIEGIRKIEN